MDAPADISDDENAASASLSYVKPYLGPSFEDLPMEVINISDIFTNLFYTYRSIRT